MLLNNVAAFPFLSATFAFAEVKLTKLVHMQRMSSSTSYRSALSPRRRRGGDAAAEGGLPPTPLWVKRYLPLLSSLIDIGVLVPLSPDLDPPSPSLLAGTAGAPPELAVAAAAHGAGPAVFLPGHGPMTLGQISNMAYQAAPVAGQFTTEAFPTIQESVAMASTQREGHVRQPEVGQFMYAVNQQQIHAHGPARFDRSNNGRRVGWGQGKTHRSNGGGAPPRPEVPLSQSHSTSQPNGFKTGRSPAGGGPAGSVNDSYHSNNYGTQGAGASSAAGTASNGHDSEPTRVPPSELHVAAVDGHGGERGVGKVPSLDRSAATGYAMRTSPAAALSMRSKSVGTSSSSAVSPMLPLGSPLHHTGAINPAAIGTDGVRAPTDPGTIHAVDVSSSRRRSRSEPPTVAEAPSNRQAAMSILRGLGKPSSRSRGTGGDTQSSATPSTPDSSKQSGARASSANRRNRNGSAGQGSHHSNHRRHNSFGSNNGGSWGGRGGMRKKDRNGSRANYSGPAGGHAGGPDGRPQHGRGWNAPPRNGGGGFHQPWRGNHTQGGGSPTHGHSQQRRGPFPPPNAPAGMQLVPLWPAFPPQQGGQAVGQAPYYMVQPIVPLPQPPQQGPPGSAGSGGNGTPDNSAGTMAPHAPRTVGSAARGSRAGSATPSGSGSAVQGAGGRAGGTPPGPPTQHGTPAGSPPVWGGAQMMHPAMIPQQQIMPGQMMYVTVPANAVPPNMAVAGADRKTHGAVPLHLPPHAFGPGGISSPGGQGPHMQGTGFHQRGPYRSTKGRNGGRGAAGGVGYGTDHGGPRPRAQWSQDGSGRGGYGNQGTFHANKRRDGPGRGGGRWGNGNQPGSGVGGARE